MREFLTTTTAQGVIWGAALLILIAVGAFVIKLVREGRTGTLPTASDFLSEFRNLHDRGSLSQAEFRKIKTILAPKIQESPRSKNAEQED